MAYFSNGTEGIVLDAQCSVCPVGRNPDLPCPVLLVQLAYNYEQVGEGQEKLREAIARWRTVLEYDPSHANAKKNIDQAERMLQNLQTQRQKATQ